MPRLIWTPRALADIQRLYHFRHLKDPELARRAAQAIRAGVEILARHQQIGRPAADMEAEFLEKLIEFGNGGSVVLYRFDGDTAAILAVRHQKEAGYLR